MSREHLSRIETLQEKWSQIDGLTGQGEDADP
jgi:hypothetical protein